MKIKELVTKKIKACKTPGELIWVLKHLDKAPISLDGISFIGHYYITTSYDHFVDYTEAWNLSYSNVIHAFNKKENFLRMLKLDKDAKILILNTEQSDRNLLMFLLNDVQDFKKAKDKLLTDLPSYGLSGVDRTIFSM